MEHGLYLHRFGLNHSPNCPGGGGIPEDPEHIIFHCPRLAIVRRNMRQALDASVSSENLVPVMLRSKTNWLMIPSAIEKIQKEQKSP